MKGKIFAKAGRSSVGEVSHRPSVLGGSYSQQRSLLSASSHRLYALRFVGLK